MKIKHMNQSLTIEDFAAVYAFSLQMTRGHLIASTDPEDIAAVQCIDRLLEHLDAERYEEAAHIAIAKGLQGNLFENFPSGVHAGFANAVYPERGKEIYALYEKNVLPNLIKLVKAGG